MTRRLLVFLSLVACAAASAEPPPISAFARLAAIEDVSISPDGIHLLYLTAHKGERAAVTLDRRQGNRKTIVIRLGAERRFDFSWCGWANNTRVLCGLEGAKLGDVIYPITRLVAVDFDGTNFKVLNTNFLSHVGGLRSGFITEGAAASSQYQDRVLDFTPAKPESVLIQLNTSESSYPSVRELNIYSGRTHELIRAFPPILRFSTDGQGNARLGTGVSNTKYMYFSRLHDQQIWRELATFTAYERREGLTPLHVTPSNTVIAIGPTGNHDGLWELDLEEKTPPRLVFSHPEADVGEPIRTKDYRLLGVNLETDRRFAHYIDERAGRVIDGVNRILTDSYNEIYDSTLDSKLFVIRSTSDVDAGSFYLQGVDSASGALEFLGTANPDLDSRRLQRMRSITYPARDGTMIPGYLTLPAGESSRRYPVIVMPHDGPDARDSWEFDYLRHFLVSRDYAVLQMNFRGSAGLGWQWLDAAHQDWGGLSFDDIIDGAEWASSQSFADPERMCILGRGFGGYAALLAAVRGSAGFRCSISIGGPSDLQELADDARIYLQHEVVTEQIGKKRAKLKLDSPLQHAEQASIPILLVHGSHDWEVLVHHSRDMARALKRVGKPHELLVIEEATHGLRWESDRIALLAAIEKFLATHLK